MSVNGAFKSLRAVRNYLSVEFKPHDSDTEHSHVEDQKLKSVDFHLRGTPSHIFKSKSIHGPTPVFAGHCSNVTYFGRKMSSILVRLVSAGMGADCKFAGILQPNAA